MLWYEEWPQFTILISVEYPVITNIRTVLPRSIPRCGEHDDPVLWHETLHLDAPCGTYPVTAVEHIILECI